MTTGFPLPSIEQSIEAIEIWSSQDARLRLLVDRYSDRQPALRHYGLMLWEGGDPSSACQAFTAALGFDPANALVWADLAGASAASGAPRSAAAGYARAIALGDERARTHLGLATQGHASGADFDATLAAYERAIALDAMLYEAWLGLGLHFYTARRFEESIAPLLRATELAPAPQPRAEALVCLAKSFDAEGRFVEAAEAFRRADVLKPDDPQIATGLARVQFIADIVAGSVDHALATDSMRRLDDAARDRILDEAFHIASGYGHRDAAIKLGEYQQAHGQPDTMRAYLLAGLRGEHMDRAPSSYLVDYFDRFADTFDSKLVDILRYDVPARLAVLVTAGREPSRVLDIGCGTGLVGPHLAAPGRTLVGVDLSPRMIDKARERGTYATLHVTDALDFLASTEERFDTLVAADMMIYFGRLDDLMGGIARILSPGGCCALSIETADTATFTLLPSGRFAHGLGYAIDTAAKAGLRASETCSVMLRLEANRPVPGALLLLTR